MVTPTNFANGGQTASSTSDVAAVWPTEHQADDIGILMVQYDGATSPPTSISGWTYLGSETTGNVTDGSSLSMFWRRATSGSEGPPTVPIGTSDHVIARIAGFRGCRTTGSPIHKQASGANAFASTSMSIPGFTTTLNECHVMDICTRGNDASSAHFSALTNSSLTSTAEEWDLGTTGGNGGGNMMWHGFKDTAGVVDTTTGTISVSVPTAFFKLALTSLPETGRRLT